MYNRWRCCATIYTDSHGVLSQCRGYHNHEAAEIFYTPTGIDYKHRKNEKKREKKRNSKKIKREQIELILS